MEKETPKQRLLQFIYKVGIGQTAFERKCHLGRGSICHAGDMITGKLLGKVAAVYPQLNPDWVLLGRGEMIKQVEEKKEYDYALEVALMREEMHKLNKKVDQLLNALRDAQK